MVMDLLVMEIPRPCGALGLRTFQPGEIRSRRAPGGLNRGVAARLLGANWRRYWQTNAAAQRCTHDFGPDSRQRGLRRPGKRSAHNEMAWAAVPR